MRKSLAIRGGDHKTIPGLAPQLEKLAHLPEVQKVIPARFRARGKIVRRHVDGGARIKFRLIHQNDTSIKLLAVGQDARQDVWVTSHDAANLVKRLKQEGVL